MNTLSTYENVVNDVIGEWSKQKDKAVFAGIDANRIIFDPGLGFSKEENHNWDLLAHLPELQEVGHRVLIGASRKRFLSSVAPLDNLESRDLPTALISSWCAQHNIYAVRVHDVGSTVSAIRTIREIGSHV